MPDRVPIDFGSFSGATSINVRAYQNLLGYFGINRKPRVENSMIFTAAIDDDILDRFHVDTKSVKPSIPLEEFDAPLEFYDRPWEVKWQRSDDFTYAPVKGPFQGMVDPFCIPGIPAKKDFKEGARDEFQRKVTHRS